MNILESIMNSKRADGRENNEVRSIQILKDYTLYAEGSVLVSVGNTKIICTASIEKRFLIGYWELTRKQLMDG